MTTDPNNLPPPELPPYWPTKGEVIQLAMDTRLCHFQATAGDPIQYEMTEAQLIAFARAVLERWGTPQPESPEDDDKWPHL